MGVTLAALPLTEVSTGLLVDLNSLLTLGLVVGLAVDPELEGPVGLVW